MELQSDDSGSAGVYCNAALFKRLEMLVSDRGKTTQPSVTIGLNAVLSRATYEILLAIASNCIHLHSQQEVNKNMNNKTHHHMSHSD